MCDLKAQRRRLRLRTQMRLLLTNAPKGRRSATAILVRTAPFQVASLPRPLRLRFPPHLSTQYHISLDALYTAPLKGPISDIKHQQHHRERDAADSNKRRAQLTSAHVLRRVSAGSAGGFLDVVGALAATAAQSVRLVVALTEACSTLAYHLQPHSASDRVSSLHQPTHPCERPGSAGFAPCRVQGRQTTRQPAFTHMQPQTLLR